MRRSGGEFGESEIEDFDLAASRNEDVRGLDVAMDNSFGMGGIESVSNLDAETQKGFQAERVSGDAMLEGFAIEEPIEDERLALGLPAVVYGAHGWMHQWGDTAGFASRPLRGAAAARYNDGHALDGHTSAKLTSL